MKFKKLSFIMLIGYFALAGCGIQDSKEHAISVENVRSDDSKLIDALETSKPYYGYIASQENNKSIDFIVNENMTEVSGYYCGQKFEKTLTDTQMEKFMNEIVLYSPKVQEKEYDYWPHTEEYPAMLVLFDYEITFENGYSYEMSGALCYPDDWDEFTEQLFEIIEL